MLIIKHLKLHIPPKTDNARLRSPLLKRLKMLEVATPNLLAQNFTAETPNQRWVADFTYVSTMEGWLYVATVLDLFSRRIVGLSMSDRMTTNLVTSALEQALLHRKPPTNLIHHSDRGSQYTSINFRETLKKYNITASMSGTGNCYGRVGN